MKLHSSLVGTEKYRLNKGDGARGIRWKASGRPMRISFHLAASEVGAAFLFEQVRLFNLGEDQSVISREVGEPSVGHRACALHPLSRPY